jgi:Holliday junction resolvase
MYNLSKKAKGDIAELAAAKRFVEDGWQVLFPYGENHRYDLVAEKDNKFVRVQVKYSTPKRGVLDVNCRSSNNWSVLHYTSNEIDLIAVYNPHNKNVYFIPVAEINHSQFKLRIEPSKNNQKAKTHFAENFSELKI